MVENRNVTDQHKNEMLLVRLTENEKNQLKKTSLSTGKSMSDLSRLAVKMISYDEDNFNRLMQNMYLEDVDSKQYKPSEDDRKELKDIYSELSNIQYRLKKLTDNADISNRAPNSWKNVLRDYLLPQIDEKIG